MTILFETKLLWNTVTDIPDVLAPVNLHSYYDSFSNSINLTWESRSPDETGQRIYRNLAPTPVENLGEPYAFLGAGITEYEDVSVTEGQVYYYYVSAVSGGNEAISAELRAKTVLVPPFDISGEVDDGSDPHWDKVVSLLYFDDLDNPWKDETGRSWSTFGSTGVFELTPEVGIGGKSALTFSAPAGGGTKRCIRSPGVIPTGELFTIEAYIKPINLSFSLPIASQPASAGGGDQLFAARSTTGVVRYYKGNATALGGAVINAVGIDEVPEDNFSHVVFQYDGQNVESYLNGHLQFSTSRPQGWINTANQFQIGNTAVPGYESYSGATSGIIDSIRITRGVARYTENFTPPTKPFPNFGP